MPTDVLVPPLGQTVDILTFVSWYKQEGDEVRAGEPLFVVETDKATLDVEAPVSGVLQRVTAKPGDEVTALSAIAVIVTEGEEEGNSGELRGTAEATAVAAVPTSSPQLPPDSLSYSEFPSAASPARLFASPRARRLAQREDVPLASVPGSGPEGAIVERDVQAYMQARALERQRTVLAELPAAEVPHRPDAPPPPAPRAPGQLPAGHVGASVTPVARRMAEAAGLDWRQLPGSGPAGRITREDVTLALAQTAQPAQPPLSSEAARPVSDLPPSRSTSRAAEGQPSEPLDTIPLRGVRAVIAQRMAESHSQTAPVTLTAEADASALVELRQRLAAREVGVSYNDLLLAILARALQEHPRLNASLEGEEIKVWRRIQIGLAVDTDRGLLVAVMRDLDQKGLRQIAEETRRLARRLRSGQATPDELRGGTFTLTNLGMFGIDAFTPIINLPETAILGVGRIKQKPVWIEDHVEGRHMVWLSLTFDHRLVDGGPAARFLQAVVEYVETPYLLLA